MRRIVSRYAGCKKMRLVRVQTLLGLALLAGLFLMAGCTDPVEEPTLTPASTSVSTSTVADTLSPSPTPGRLALDFTLPDLTGNELRLSDFRGQLVLLNFWATW